jgi:hypothetical protein
MSFRSYFVCYNSKFLRRSPLIKAQAITFRYNPIEDRIEFILNYEDFENRVDLLVTRKLLLKFFDYCEEVFIKYGHELNGSKGKQDTDFSEVKPDIKPTKSLRKHEKLVDKSSINLTKKDAVLLHQTKFIYNKGKKLLSIDFIANEKVVANTVLSIKQFEQILGALMRVVPFIEWGISPNILDI